MNKYKFEIASSVEKDLKKIPNKITSKIIIAIESLAEKPYPINKFKKLKGTEASYRLRVGDYRVLYEVEDTVKIITVYRVRHRKDVYKK